MKEIKIATRKSILALWQSEHIKARIEAQHKGVKVVLEGMKTKGDVILDTPLAKIGGKGLFTKELEDSMLKGETDIAVHSLKDVPVVFPEGLKLAAICSREDTRDAMISEKFAKFSDLPHGAKVGTTSLRRKMQLLIMRPDLEIISLRGNVQTRLRKLKEGEFDAIIGYKFLSGMHLNDAKFGLGSKKDRHESLGKGELGLGAFENIINDDKIGEIPLILETIDESIWEDEIKILRNLEKEKL